MIHNAIPAEFVQFIEQEIASGNYQSADDVLIEGLRLLRERKERHQDLKDRVQIGVDQLRRGEGIKLKQQNLRKFFEDILDEVNRELSLRQAGR